MNDVAAIAVHLTMWKGIHDMLIRQNLGAGDESLLATIQDA